MLIEMENFDWNNSISDSNSLDEMVQSFYNVLCPIFERCLPVIEVKFSTRDALFLSPPVKHLLELRKKAIRNRDTNIIYQLQERINVLIRDNQMRALKAENSGNKLDQKVFFFES